MKKQKPPKPVSAKEMALDARAAFGGMMVAYSHYLKVNKRKHSQEIFFRFLNERLERTYLVSIINELVYQAFCIPWEKENKKW